MGITIAIGNLKGGVGSTTLTFNLGVQLERSGVGVGILECTASSSIDRWNTRREARGKSRFGLGTVEPGSEMDMSGVDYVLVDVGRSMECIEAMLRTADIWLVPMAPSALELEPTLRLFDSWREARANEAAPGVFAVLLTRTEIDEARFERHARLRLALSDPSLLVLNQSLRRRNAWDQTALGLGVSEQDTTGAAKAAGEFNSAVVELMSRSMHLLARPAVTSILRFSRVTTKELE